MLNSCDIQGRLTKDPQLRVTASGNKECQFDIAYTITRKNRDDPNRTSFFHCISWNKRADYIARYFRKGQMVTIHGELRQRRYQNKQGEWCNTYELQIGEIYGESAKREAPAKEYAPPVIEELPVEEYEDEPDPF